jgi:hypothetical protein
MQCAGSFSLGFFAGAAAGVKYTGWIIPVALVSYVLFAGR